ncbi:MAG TPA: hypothetical protein VFB21_20520 [Chthonomonadaceae bacterium]|nr:hypothetical protein [Chthonomonadaceae bacterium]
MNTAPLLQWHYMIFLLPFGIALLLLLFTAFQASGGDADGDGDSLDADAGAADAADGPDGDLSADGDADFEGGADGGESADAAPDGDAHGGDADGDADATDEAETARPTLAGVGADAGARAARGGRTASPRGGALRILGVGRAPLSVVMEMLFLAWGFCGYWANQLLLRTETPSLAEMTPSLAAALVGGIIGARGGAELFARLMPQEHTTALSRESLLGATGRVIFPVSASSGRVRIYDEHGNLHDERCRIAPGHLPIAKGRRVLVVDMDAQGRLIVEEVPDSVR